MLFCPPASAPSRAFLCPCGGYGIGWYTPQGQRNARDGAGAGGQNSICRGLSSNKKNKYSVQIHTEMHASNDSSIHVFSNFPGKRFGFLTVYCHPFVFHAVHPRESAPGVTTARSKAVHCRNIPSRTHRCGYRPPAPENTDFRLFHYRHTGTYRHRHQP